MKTKITNAMRKLRRDQRWLRWPTPDCPICQGKGVYPMKLWSACDQPLFDGEVLKGNCPCVQSPGKRRSNESLARTREAMLEVTREHEGEP